MGDERYNRQTILSEVGERGQAKISKGTVAIVGLGALGSVSSTFLTRAGVGRIVIVDRDVVEMSNLQRQILYSEEHVGEAKAMVAAEELRKMNSDTEIQGLATDLSYQNITRTLKDADIVVDGTDNMETRFLLNDFCVREEIPFIYGGAVATYGMTLSVTPGKGPCFRCLFPQMPVPGTLPTCDTFGVLNTIPSIIGSIQATEAIKLLVGVQPRRTLVVVDPWYNEQREIDVARREDCVCCVKEEYDFLEAKTKDIVVALCGRDACSVTPPKGPKMSLKELEKRLSRVGRTKRGKATLSLSIDGYELVLFEDGRALIKGTSDKAKAKSLYSQYVGH